MPSHFPGPDSYHLKRLYDDKFTEATLKIRTECNLDDINTLFDRLAMVSDNLLNV